MEVSAKISFKNYDIELYKQFNWGDIRFFIKLKNGSIVKTMVISDKLNDELRSKISESFEGCTFNFRQLASELRKIHADMADDRELVSLTSWLEDKQFLY